MGSVPIEDSDPKTRRLAIFGISGRIGRELARVAGIRGWEVCGFVRPTSKGEGAIVHGRIVRGNFEDFDRVVETVADSVAVCCLIGPRPLYTDIFCAKATTAIIAAMKQAGCKRLVCQTGAMIGPAPSRSHSMEWIAWTFASWHSLNHSESGRAGAPSRIECVGLDDRETAAFDGLAATRASLCQCISSGRTPIQDQSRRSCGVHPGRNTNRTFCETTNLCEGLPLHITPKHKGTSVRSHTDVPMDGLSLCRERVDKKDFRRYISK